MKIKAPLHSMDARGRFGLGLVFSTWRGMATGRAFVVPKNPRSLRQSAIRGFMTSASRAWNDLTEKGRKGFESYAKEMGRKNVFGQALDASGFNEFCALYCLAKDIGETPVETAPLAPAPLAVSGGKIVASDTPGEIDATWTAGQDGYVDLWVTGPLPAGRQPRETDYRHHSYTADVTATKTIAGLSEGAKYGVKARQVAKSGQVGPWMVAIVNTAAA